MSVKSTTSSPAAPHVWAETEVDDLLRRKTIEVIQQITAAHQTNTNLNTGIHYPYNYANALRAGNKLDRLKLFVNSGNSFHGYASPNHFSTLPDKESPSGKQSMTFVVKEGVAPSVALHKLQEGLSVLGCGEVCQVAQYRAVEEVLGTDKFNVLFASDSPTPLMISPKNPKNPIGKLRNYIYNQEATLEEVRKGDHVYFHNAGSYGEKNPVGPARGYNAICVDEAGNSSKFIALGWSSGGLDHTQLKEVVRSEYNVSPQNVEGVLHPTIIKALNLQEQSPLAQKQLTPQEFLAEGGGRMLLVSELHTQRITALANSTLGQARALLDSYTPQKAKRIVLSRIENPDGKKED